MSIKKELSIEEQFEIFKNGIESVNIVEPCTLGNGITKLIEYERDNYLDNFKKLLVEKSCVKFVPASGAATRMFSDLIELKKLILRTQTKLSKNTMTELLAYT